MATLYVIGWMPLLSVVAVAMLIPDVTKARIRRIVQRR